MTYEATSILYFTVFFSSIVIVDIGKKKLIKDKNLNLIVILGLMLPILLATFRYWVGTDWGTYYEQFYRAQTQEWSSVFEDGYFGILILLIRKITSYTNDHRIYFGVLSLLAVIPTYLAFRKHYYKDMKIMLFLYYTMFFLYSFNIGKQYIAVAIVLIAYNYVFDNNIRMFLVLILLAIAFHPSAFIALPVYFMWDSKKNELTNSWKIWLLIISFIIILFYFQEIMTVFVEITDLERYTVYTSTDTSGSNNSIYLKLLILLIELYFYKYLVKYDSKNKLFIVLQAIDLIISVTGFSSTQFKRCATYFSITNIYVLSSFPYIFKSEQRKYIKLLLYIFGSLYCIVIFYILEQGHCMPYRIIETSFTEIMNQINQNKLIGN